jgi:acyl-CoA thioesterase FadM
VGETSVTYEFDLFRQSEPVARGKMVAVFIERQTGAKRPWPPAMRSALLGESAGQK